MKRIFAIATGVAIAATAFAAPTGAQDLNVRHDAPPSAKAVTGRLLTKARNVAAEQGDSLERDVINTDCSDLNIGTPQQGDGQRKSLVREDATVVRGNVVNLCR